MVQTQKPVDSQTVISGARLPKNSKSCGPFLFVPLECGRHLWMSLTTPPISFLFCGAQKWINNKIHHQPRTNQPRGWGLFSAELSCFERGSDEEERGEQERFRELGLGANDSQIWESNLASCQFLLKLQTMIPLWCFKFLLKLQTMIIDNTFMFQVCLISVQVFILFYLQHQQAGQ